MCECVSVCVCVSACVSVYVHAPVGSSVCECMCVRNYNILRYFFNRVCKKIEMYRILSALIWKIKILTNL